MKNYVLSIYTAQPFTHKKWAQLTLINTKWLTKKCWAKPKLSVKIARSYLLVSDYKHVA